MSEKFNNKGNDLDRPDLNKCPDCLCYFAGINCPLCGKPCPEHMKAGNRPSVKPPPRKAPDPHAGRVVFVPWYHSMWFMIIVSLFSPLVGIILFATSHHKRAVKAVAIVSIVLFVALSSVMSYSYLLPSLLEGEVVDRTLSKDEYVNVCEDVNPSDYFRSPEQYKGKYVTMTLSVSERFYDAVYNYSNSDYYVFYVCSDPENPEFQIMIRDCVEKDGKYFVKGDTIVIYGECTGEFYDSIDLNGVTHSAPLINVAFYEIVPSTDSEDGGNTEGEDNGNTEGEDNGNTEGEDNGNTEGNGSAEL